MAGCIRVIFHGGQWSLNHGASWIKLPNESQEWAHSVMSCVSLSDHTALLNMENWHFGPYSILTATQSFQVGFFFFFPQYSLNLFLYSLVTPLTKVKEIPGQLWPAAYPWWGGSSDWQSSYQLHISMVLMELFTIRTWHFSVSEITWNIKNAFSLNAD